MKGKKLFKRSIAFMVSFIMLITMMPLFAFGEANDLQGHWASDIIEEWIQKGLVNGYPDGGFRPDNLLTRAELMVLINKVFGLSEETAISFKDVKKRDWFYTTIKQGIAAGYISGYPDNTIKPNNPITRQETAIILAKVMELPLKTDAVKDFNDVDSIPSWSKGYIGAVVSTGYMKGYPDGEFKPTVAITRAEALVVLNNAMIDIDEKDDKEKEFTGIIEKAGSYGPKTGEEVFEGDIYIQAEGVTLQNMVIHGDLTITEEVGDGDVHLNNVTVEGDTYIQGGGRDSIYINGGSYNKVIIQRVRGGIRVITIGANITTVEVHPESSSNEVILKGTFKDVILLAEGTDLITQENTTIEKLIIEREAQNTAVTTSKTTVIDEVIVNSQIKFNNAGRIKRATGTEARNSNYDINQPDNFTRPSSGGGGSSRPATVKVSDITATPSAGKVAMGTNVTLSTATDGATIYYTLDGSTPTTSNTQYTDPITINSDTIIKAIGVKSGMTNSSVATFSYTVDEPAKPEMTVSPSKVTVNSNFNQIFTLSIANDTVVNAVYAKDVSLDGVFQGMSLGTVTRTNNTTVTAAVYGNLENPGVGTITLDADTLVDSESNLTANVTVLQTAVIPVGGITVSPTTANLTVGETQQLAAAVSPNNATNQNVTWSSDDNDVATVDAAGLVTGIAPGTAEISVTTVEGGFKDTVIITVISEEFAGGTGTEEDPYQIATAEQLNNIRNYLGDEHSNKYFVQIADIDLGVSPWNEDKGWLPIGDNDKQFKGTLDGNHKKISHLRINRSEDSYIGLFGVIGEGGTVENLSLEAIDVFGIQGVGGISGANYGVARNIEVSGTIDGLATVGGITGANLANGIIKQCGSTVNAKGYQNIGSFVGLNRSQITHSWASGKVELKDYSKIYEGIGGTMGYLGGLVGANETYALIKKSYAIGEVIGIDDDSKGVGIGGLVGINNGRIEDSYALGDVTGFERIGGLVGTNYVEVINSYATGRVDAGNNLDLVGGLIGKYSGEPGVVTDSFYNEETAMVNDIGKGTGRTSIQLTNENTFKNWDFNNIWDIDEGLTYPYLQNNKQDPKPTPVLVSVTGVSINEGDQTVAEGNTVQLTADVSPNNATNQNVTWVSSNEAVATVDDNGLVMGVAAGTIDITVTTDDGDFKDTVTITVTATTYSIAIADVVGGTAEVITNPATEAAADETVTVNISNIEGGKQFASIQVNGGEVTATEITPNEEYTFVMPAEAVTVTVELEASLSSYAEILSYSLSNQTGDSVINSQAGTITVEVAYETDVSNLVATFTTSEKTQSIKIGEVQQESGTTSNDFSSVVTYVVIAEDGTIKEWVVTVSVESNLDFVGGLGTKEDPYQIATVEHLDNVRKYLGSDYANTHFKLMNDIDLEDATSTASGSYWNDGKGWEPIGTDGNSFMGSLNGAGFSISDLYINRPEENDVGLFGVIQKNHSTLVYDPGIFNLTLEGGSVTGKDYVGPIAGRFVGQMSSVTTNVTVYGERYVGGLIGRATSGSHWTGNAYTDYRQRIENSWASGDVYGTQYVGGLLGHGGTRLTITNCHASGNVTGITDAVSHIGGFIGIISGEGGTSVSNSYATGNVVAPSADRVGGLSGSASQNAVSNSYATGNVEGNEIVGGLIGSSSISVSGNFATGDVVGNYQVGGLVGYSTTDISNAYSSGNVSGNTKVGGLVGQIGWWPWNSYARTRDISDSYALGNVTGSGSNVGGLAGWMVGDVNNSYFTASASGTTSNIGSMVGNHGRGTVDSSYYNQDYSQHGGGGISKTTDEMKQEITYSGWNFSNIWGINALENNGYPFLRWQGYTHISNAAEIVEFSFAEEAEPAVIVWNEGIITISVGNGTDMTDLVATFSLSSGASATVGGTQQESGVTVNDFSSPVTYIVTAEDGSTTKEWVVTVTEINFAGGAGTEANPFEIATAEQLNNVRNYLGTNHANTHFILLNDIDLNDATSDGGTYWNEGKGWEPIGRNSVTSFSGVFNGGGFSISNIYINRSEENNIGLFGYCDSAEFIDVRIENANYKGERYIGVLSGYVYDGLISNSSATGTVEGDLDVGGLVGYNTGSSVVTHSNANVAVKGRLDVGGLVGNNYGNSAVIVSSYATGEVQGEGRVGGLAGYNRYKINKSYATGKVTGERAVGGLVGHQVTQSGSVNSVISNSYALNPELSRTNGDHTTFGRILGSLVGGNISGNYANKDMIEPLEEVFNDKTFNGKDGRNHAFLFVDGDVQRPVGIAIDEQDGTLTAGMNGEITFQVTTNLDDEEVINAELKDGTIGLSISNTTVNGGTATITIMSTNQAVDGKYQFAINYQGQGEQIVEFEVAIDELSPNNEAEILSYSLPNQIGDSVINSQAGTITVEVPYETDVSNLVATFTTSENTQSIKVGSVEQESGTTANDFSSSVTYVIIAEDGTIKEWVVTVNIESNPDFAGGLGTEEDPYQIATVKHLDNVRMYLGSEYENTYFKLVDDIDLGDATSDGGDYWNGGLGWKPIGGEVQSNRFMSKFNGGGFSIINLNINRPEEDYVGLFGYIGRFNITPKIQNLNITDATIRGKDYTGILAGYNAGDIVDVTVSGEVVGNEFVGGLIGENRTHPTVNNTVANVNVMGNERVGGLIGQNYGQYIKVENSSAHGKVIGSNRYIGGLIGFNGYWASVNQSHATGDVEGVNTVGGLVGYSHTANVENCYASGDVTGTSQIGGLVGLTYAGSPDRSYIRNCFALGNVKGETQVGGIVGRVNFRSIISRNYALNTELIRESSDSTTFGRVFGSIHQQAHSSENYANKNMREPFENAFNQENFEGQHGSVHASYSIDEDGNITVYGIAIKPQEGTLTSGTEGSVTFQVITNLNDFEELEVSFIGGPLGLSINSSPIQDGVSIITVITTDEVQAGTYDFVVVYPRAEDQIIQVVVEE